MAKNPKPLFLRNRKVPTMGALAFIIAALLIFNVSSWRMMRLLETSKEEDLTRRVRSVTRVATQSLASPVVPAVLSNLVNASLEEESESLDSYPDSPEYERLAQRIARLKSGSGLAEILLLSSRGNVIVDSNYRFLTGEPLPFTIDQQYLEWALAGKPATTPLYDWEGEHFQRDYQPLVDESGTTVGVVMGSISADYLESLQLVRHRVSRLWILSSVLLILLGIWLYRMFRYVAQLEHRALQKVRVEAMGALAGGMAHELRNPLAIIRALAEEIEADQASPNRSTENSADIIAETQRLSELVTHFLSLSKSPDVSVGHPVNLKDEIERVVQLMRKGSAEKIKFTTQLPAGEIWINGDGRPLRQLLLNLLVNACDALETVDNGKVTITLKERRHSAELTISDNGSGIPRKILNRVFEPFYTTRKNGTGLGLSISKSIAENLGGELILESTQPGGTTALLTVPLVEPVPPANSKSTI